MVIKTYRRKHEGETAATHLLFNKHSTATRRPTFIVVIVQ